MEKFITLILHHGGSFVRDENRKLDYVDGEIDVWESINPYLLNLLDIENKVKQHKGYHNIVGLYYLKPYKGIKLDMNICLHPLTTDNHRIDMVNVAKTNGQVDIFFEHAIVEYEFIPMKPNNWVPPKPQQEGQQKRQREEGTSGTHKQKLWHFLPPPPEFPPKRLRPPPPPPGFRSGFKSPIERESPPLQIRGSVDLIPASFPDCEIGFRSRKQEFWHYLSPPLGFQPKKIPPPSRFSGKEYGSVDLIPASFSGCETRFGSRKQEFWHYLPPLPDFQPKKIPLSSGFSGKEYGSVDLIPSSFPGCEAESESREQKFWHFLLPPPGFQPKKIPPPPGFSCKEYN